MLFIDMDGVLAEYEPSDYIGEPMPFEEKGIHYFLNRPVQKDISQLLIALAQSSAHKQTYVITTLSKRAQSDAELMQEHRTDKILWLDALGQTSPLSFNKLLFARQNTTTKAQIARLFLNRPLNASDILIDDFNDNLIDWRNHGGTAMKWINEHNSAASWDDHCITTENIAETIQKIESRLALG